MENPGKSSIRQKISREPAVADRPDANGFDALGAVFVETLTKLETFQRYFHPPFLPRLLEQFRPTAGRFAQTFSETMDRADAYKDPEMETLLTAAKILFDGVDLLFHAGKAEAQEAVFLVMRAMRKHCRAQEAIFPLCSHWKRIHRYFLDTDARAEEIFEVGQAFENKGEILRHTGGDKGPYSRGAVSLYVPPQADATPRGVVIALHGGQGHGRDFLWTWLREARSRNLLLIAPSSIGPTWNLMHPEKDLAHIEAALDHVTAQWPVNPERILLTGISDGGTFSLTCCQLERTKFTAFAPVSGVLAPFNIRKSNGKRVHWVHGRLDWMFPLQRAVTGSQVLQHAGCRITFRIIDDLSHTYPREANRDILDWFQMPNDRP